MTPLLIDNPLLLDFIGNMAPPGLLDQMLAEPVVGYSVAYGARGSHHRH